MGNRKNLGVEVGSILVFALGVFALFSIVTYHSSDPSLFTYATGMPHNSCGRIGAYLSSSVLQLFGIGAFLVPAVFFFMAATIHKREGWIPVLGILGGMAVAVGSFTVFLTLQWKYWNYGDGPLLTGGVFGAWVADALVHHLNFVGSSLVAVVIFALSLAVSTPVSVAHWGYQISRAILLISGRIARLVGSYLLYVLGVWLMRAAQSLSGWIQKGISHAIKASQARSALPKKVKSVALVKSDLPADGPVLATSHSKNESDKKSEAKKVNGVAPVIGVEGKILPEAASQLELGPDLSSSRELQSDADLNLGLNLDLQNGDDESLSLLSEEELLSASKEKLVSSKKGESGIKILPREVDQNSKPSKTIPRPITKTRQGTWQLPTVEFLKNPPAIESTVDRAKLIANSQILKQKFADFGIDGEVTAVRPGPVITLYEFKPGPGVKVSRIAALADDLSMALSAQSVRILAPLPGKSVVGIEIPSETRETVYLREFLQHPDFYGPKHLIPVVMGKDIGGQTYLSDLARMPHLLCAGQTGSGKSVFMNGLICSLFYRFTPDELRMILVDPKFIEFRAYQDMPHLLLPVVDDPKMASIALKWSVREMERRYRILAKLGARNLASFNQKVEDMGADVVKDLLFAEDQSDTPAPSTGGDWLEAFEPDETGAPRVGKLPYIVIIIDELADLMMIAKKEVEISIARIAQKARAAGIHLIIATQRPSTDVITGLIKANLPSRVSFQLASYVDSKTILDRAGAERLLGQGDMLFIPPGVSQNLRLHGAFLEDDEIHKITTFLKSQGKPVYRDDILLADDEDGDGEDGESDEDDVLFSDAVDLVKRSGHASASFLQRHLKVGYNRAARMIETMEGRGIVGPQDGSRPREVLVR